MKNKILLSFCCLIFVVSCQQKKRPLAERFFDYLNTYQTDSLEMLLSDDFQLESSSINIKTNKATVLTAAEEGKKNKLTYKVIESKNDEFTVEHQSDVYKYLGATNPVCKYKFTSKGDYITYIFLDDKESVDQLTPKYEAFENWLYERHSEEELAKWLNTDGFWMSSAQEYYETEIKKH